MSSSLATPAHSTLVTSDPWAQLKSLTRARIALGRAGSSLPTQEILDFGMAHAMARDAVRLALDTQTLAAEIQALGFATLQAHSQAPDRSSYLLRPDWGRKLDEASAALLHNHTQVFDLVFVVGDGLSSMAVAKQVPAFLNALKPLLAKDWKIAPVVIASQARVAIGDEIALALKARMVAVLIGERPGLSSPDSLGVYFTYNPQAQSSDAERNCISNIRPEGLSFTLAAQKLVWLTTEALRLKISGVGLKDESDVALLTPL